MNSEYLPLTEYSSKYKVSISTLRRRIKAEDIRFVFNDGKYFIFDSPLGTHQQVHRPSQNSEATMMSAQQQSSTGIVRESSPFFSGATASMQHSSPEAKGDEPVLIVANRLLTELKKAYSQILHEKEEQILNLKQELVDLKTLVKVLESENARLNQKM